MQEAVLVALVLALFAIAVFAWVKRSRRPRAEPIVLPSERAAAVPPSPATIRPAEAAPAAPAPPAAAPADSSAPSPDLTGVSCAADGAVHGALPPFGRLAFAEETLAYEAGTRVVAKDGGLDSGDGASTMQSLGTIERGNYRYTIARADLESVDVAGHRVTVNAGGRSYVFEGIGPSATKLGAWLRSHGVGN